MSHILTPHSFLPCCRVIFAALMVIPVKLRRLSLSLLARLPSYLTLFFTEESAVTLGSLRRHVCFSQSNDIMSGALSDQVTKSDEFQNVV